MVEDILTYAIELGWLQWSAFALNLGYVVLAARNNIWCWPVGLVGVILLFFIYVDARLFSDATLQVFYMIMSVYGWLQWRKQSEGKGEKGIETWTLRRHLPLLSIGLICAVLLGYFWQIYGGALPFVDALTTTFSIIATFLVAHKVLENWIYWILIDAICIYVYWVRDIHLISILFILYTLMAIYGLLSWYRMYKIQGGKTTAL